MANRIQDLDLHTQDHLDSAFIRVLKSAGLFSIDQIAGGISFTSSFSGSFTGDVTVGGLLNVSVNGISGPLSLSNAVPIPQGGVINTNKALYLNGATQTIGLFQTGGSTQFFGATNYNFDASIVFSSFTDGSGTTGSQTINKVRGIAAFAASTSSITITNSFVTATSTVLCVLQTNDTTAILKNVVPGSGSFTVTLTANTTGVTKVSFVVFN